MSLLVYCIVLAAHSLALSSAKNRTVYDKFKRENNLTYNNATEDEYRFQLFLESYKLVMKFNSESDDAVFALNFFSVMNEEEKSAFSNTNDNISLVNIMGNNLNNSNTTFEDATDPPTPNETFWLDVVTPVKRQGNCNCCWAFVAVGVIEGMYARIGGKLRNFAEQEFVDCVLNRSGIKQGCNGGSSLRALQYSKGNERLASTKYYPYMASVSDCKSNTVADALIAAKVTGEYNMMEPPEYTLLNLLAFEGPLAASVEVTEMFRYYKGGILTDTTCRNVINHGILVVGYSDYFILGKNSWGVTWGDRGFVKFTRHYEPLNCGNFKQTVSVLMTSTGKKDKGKADKPTDYKPFNNCTKNCDELGCRCDQGSTDYISFNNCTKNCDKLGCRCDQGSTVNSWLDQITEPIKQTLSNFSETVHKALNYWVPWFFGEM